MIDLTHEITLAQIAFSLGVIAFVLVLYFFGGKESKSDHKPRKH